MSPSTLNGTSSPTYNVTLLPTNPSIPPRSLTRLKRLRLEALRVAPVAYHSTHAHESSYTDSDWATRFTDPARHTLICKYFSPTATSPSHHSVLGTSAVGDKEAAAATAAEEEEAEGEWIGMLTLLGPLSPQNFYLSSSSSSTPLAPRHPDAAPPAPRAEGTTYWHLVGLYLRPSHRGRSASVAIHEAVLHFLRMWTEEHEPLLVDEATEMEQARKAVVRGSLASREPILQALYEALGAREVGKMGRREALVMAGNEELLLPEQGGGEGEQKEEVEEGEGEGDITIMEAVIEC